MGLSFSEKYKIQKIIIIIKMSFAAVVMSALRVNAVLSKLKKDNLLLNPL